eukprot:3292847-Rhodomonas_salina.2
MFVRGFRDQRFRVWWDAPLQGGVAPSQDVGERRGVAKGGLEEWTRTRDVEGAEGRQRREREKERGGGETCALSRH